MSRFESGSPAHPVGGMRMMGLGPSQSIFLVIIGGVLCAIYAFPYQRGHLLTARRIAVSGAILAMPSVVPAALALTAYLMIKREGSDRLR